MNELVTRDVQVEQYLNKHELVSEIAVSAAKKEAAITGDGLGEVLVKNGFLHQDSLVEALLQVTDDALLDEELILPHVPGHVLRDLQCMILAQTIESVYVATTSKASVVKFALAEFFPDQKIKFISANQNRIDQYLEKVDAIEESDTTIVEKLIRESVLQGASDIHIKPRKATYSVFIRRLGVMELVHEGDIAEYLMVTSKIKAMSKKMDIAERRLPQDGSFSFDVNGRLIDLRIVTLPSVDSEACVIRILDPQNSAKSLTDLGITNLDQWERAITRRSGLCLVCGPTGSGKTTTLSATIHSLNRFEQSIYSAEDPVEYNIPYVTQVSINPAVGLTYAKAMKAFLRADPDIILLGEIRDEETAALAIEAARTGHLVIATVHTESVKGIINRFKDLKVKPSDLAEVLLSGMAQKLIRTLCQSCGGQDRQCTKCDGKKYVDRTVVSECHYFRSQEEVEKLIEGGNRSWNSILDDAMSKFSEGVTDTAEMKRVFGAEFEDAVDQSTSDGVLG